MSAKLTPEQQSLTMSDIIKKREEFKEKLTPEYNSTIYLRYLILCLYTYIKPLNQSIFINTLVYENVDKLQFKPEDTDIYINLNTKELFIKKNKIINLPEELNNIITTHFQKSNSQWLLPSTDVSKHISTVHFTKIFNSIFKCNISTNYIKKIYHSSSTTEPIPSSNSSERSDEEEDKLSISPEEENHISEQSHPQTSNDFVYFEKIKISAAFLQGKTIKIENGYVILI